MSFEWSARFWLNALWQPLAVALIAAAAANLLKRLDYARRANLWRAAIAIAAIAPVATLFRTGSAAVESSALIVIPVSASVQGSAGAVWSIGAILLAAAILGRILYLAGGMYRISRLRGGTRVVRTDRVAVPVTFGYLRPVIAVPAEAWERSDAGVRSAILAHEFAHIRRRDYGWNLAIEWLTVAIWWHPAVLWMKRRWAIEREFACDAAAAQRVPDYAARMIQAAHSLTGPAPKFALGLFDSNQFEDRIMKIINPISAFTGRTARIAGSVAIAAVLAAGVWMINRPVVMAQENDSVFRVGGDVTSPKLIHKVEPQYTPEAKEAKIDGKAVVYVVIGPNGKVISANVAEGLGFGLDEQALEAISHWQFEPATKQGVPVAVAATIEVNFRLI